MSKDGLVFKAGIEEIRYFAFLLMRGNEKVKLEPALEHKIQL
jgi:hypothetical protein